MEQSTHRGGPAWRRLLRAPALAAVLTAFALGAAGASAQTVKLEAEAFTNRGGGSGASRTGGSNGLGVSEGGGVSELDAEAVSGQQIGFYNNNEYLEYTVEIPQDGMYQITARGGFVPQTLVLRFWDLTYGVVLDQVTAITAENSGGYDANRFNKFPLPNLYPMKAGTHTLRIYEVGQYGWNADYYTFTRTGPLAGFGLVTGTVSSGATMLARAQVSADVSDAYTFENAPLGFRAITDASGAYRLLLPAGLRVVMPAAQGYNDPFGASTSLTVNDGQTVNSVNFNIPANGAYEVEWWDDAIQTPDGVTQGPGLTTFVNPAASRGEYAGGFDPGSWAQYKVSVPTAGAYRIMLQYGAPDVTHVGWSVAETGSSFDETAPGTGGFDVLSQYTTAGVVTLQAGVNTLRLSNASPANGQLNPDMFQLTAVPAAEVATLAGTVTDAGTHQPVADVLITVTDLNGNVLRTRTNAQGKYTVSLGAGDVTIAAAKTGYTTANASATLAGGQTKTVDLEIGAASVSGTVTDQAGTAYAGITVRVYAEDGTTLLNTATTDTAGHYVTNLSGGANVNVVAAAPMALPASKAVTVGAPGTTTPADLVLTRLDGGAPVTVTYDDDFFSPNTNVKDHSPLSGDGSLPSEEGPVGTQTLNGVTFQFPAASAYTNGNLNVRTLLSGAFYENYTFLGSSFDVPNLKGTAAVFIGLSEGAKFNGGDAVITYADLSTETAAFMLPDWYGGPTGAPLPAGMDGAGLLPPNVFGVYTFSHRHLDGIPTGNGDGPPHLFRYYAVVLPLDPDKAVTNITLPADDAEAAPNPLIAALTIANAASTTPPLQSARKALRIAGGLEAAPAPGADFNALNAVNTGASQGKIDLLDAAALAKEGK